MSEEGVRLQKVLANAGVASRRVSEEMIVAGRVRVNGEVVTELGSRIDPETDLVDVDGTAIQLDTSKRYVILNKPTGVVSSMSDDRGRPDLRRFTKDWDERLFNVGRLDADTSGLLVLTNDGDLAHVLAHPSFGVTKVYIAKVDGQVLPQTIQRLIKGVELEDGRIAADKARLLDSSRGESLVELTLHSGKNRIVRRMMAEVGHPVVELVRRQFGPFTWELSGGEGPRVDYSRTWRTAHAVSSRRRHSGRSGRVTPGRRAVRTPPPGQQETR